MSAQKTWGPLNVHHCNVIVQTCRGTQVLSGGLLDAPQNVAVTHFTHLYKECRAIQNCLQERIATLLI